MPKKNREILAPLQFEEYLDLDDAFAFFDDQMGAADTETVDYSVDTESNNSLVVTKRQVFADFIPILTDFYTKKFSESVADVSLLRNISVNTEFMNNDGEPSVLISFKAWYVVNVALPAKKSAMVSTLVSNEVETPVVAGVIEEPTLFSVKTPEELRAVWEAELHAGEPVTEAFDAEDAMIEQALESLAEDIEVNSVEADIHAEDVADVEVLQESLEIETDKTVYDVVVETPASVDSDYDNQVIVDEPVLEISEPAEGLEGSGEVALVQTSIEDTSERHPASPSITEIPVAQTL